jgi:hypothetical protein
MNRTPPPEDPLVPLLVAYDEALAAGEVPETPVPPEVAARFRAARNVLSRLEQVWPRSSPDALTVPQGGPAPPRAPLAPEQVKQVGRFQVLRELGRGGSGVVFLALDPVLARRVALKVPRTDRQLTEEARARFLREGQAAAGLDHPHIVATYEAGEAEPFCYIASAYCAGPTLAAWLREQGGPVPLRTAAALVADLAAAVAHAHGRGVLHRDLKPGNVLLQPRSACPGARPDADRPFVARVCDFGLAKLADGAGQETATGAVAGTPLYMAPEQAEGRAKEIGPATDVHALGAILYELLIRRPPFQGETELETLRLVASEDPPPPRAARPDLPRDLEAVVLKCLEKEPPRRYHTAGALAEDLHNWLEGKPVQARAGGRARRLRRWLWRHALVSAACLVLGAAAAAGLLAARLLDPDRPLAPARAELDAGRAATLIPEEGPPRWSRWRIGDGSIVRRPDHPAFCLSTLESPGLLELLPGPLPAGYWFRAEIRHEGTATPGQVGIYFAEHRQAGGGRPEHGYCTVEFNDLRRQTKDPVTKEPRGWVKLTFWRCCPAEDALVSMHTAVSKPFTPALSGLWGEAPTWRQVAVRVTPGLVQVFWENELVGSASREDLDDYCRRVNDLANQSHPWPGPRSAFTPSGGLGLFLSRGKASFRSVVVEPIR